MVNILHFQELAVQEVTFQELTFQELTVQDRAVQDRTVQEPLGSPIAHRSVWRVKAECLFIYTKQSSEHVRTIYIGY